ncbi:hypothetical protein D3C79_393590 [compost metagenome]
MPAPTPLANPCATVAVPASLLTQFRSRVTSRVVPSDSCRMAVNCLFRPAATLAAAGVICSPVAWALLISNCAFASMGAPLAPTPDAVMVTWPGATPVARPALVMVAMALSLLRHWTSPSAVTSCTLPSLSTACATYCCVSVTGIRPWGGVICKETMVVAPLPESVDDESSPSLPPHAANNKSAIDAHTHLHNFFIVNPNKLFILCFWLSLPGRLCDRAGGKHPFRRNRCPSGAHGDLVVMVRHHRGQMKTREPNSPKHRAG